MGEQLSLNQSDPSKPPSISLLLEKYNFQNKNYQPHFPEDPYSRQAEDFLVDIWRKSGVFSEVHHTPRKLDEERGIDILAELPSGKVVAIDATFTHDPKKQAQKTVKLSWPAEPIAGFEPKGEIPVVPFPFDEQKYRGWSSRREVESVEAQIELLNVLEKMIFLKKQKVLSLEHRPNKREIIENFYEDYLAELNERIIQLRAKSKNEPAQ